ncbi:conserved hypothetical protein [Beijerinckia indica subsp. indica ATCC 9039]|uniref:Uncharacterized protein n=2 Tax=Beijerinckia TaxID=532 RepID=B2IGX2_BEII9|nr:conserved hypothetical protein [Beijerinckia indica subsp. indica ATCC 9039]
MHLQKDEHQTFRCDPIRRSPILSRHIATTMSEILQRKARIDAAITQHDATAFVQALLGWLEATAYLKVLPELHKLGLGKGPIPTLSEADLREESLRNTADDTVMAYCIAAALAGDKPGLDALHAQMSRRFGPLYPGSSAVAHCIQVIDPIVTLDDAVGQFLKTLYEGKAIDTRDIWNIGLRLLQRLRSSNFVHELTPLVAVWLRAQWSRAIEQQRFNLVRPRVSVPAIEGALADPRDDQPFIAALLLASASAIDQDIEPEYRKQLAAIAERKS